MAAGVRSRIATASFTCKSARFIYASVRGSVAGNVLNLTGVETRAAAETAARGQTPAALPQTIRASRGQHQPKPLPLDPARRKGVSEKLIRSHWENNYGGSIKALKAVEKQFDAMARV